MQLTTNLKLKKPEGADVVNINDFNDNADILDTEIKKILNSVGDLTQLGTTAKNNLVAAINEVLGKFNSIKLEAENVTIKDLENLFTATKVEGALTEVMKKANTNATNISTLQRNDGDLRTLKTTEKTNLVGAINELFQNANNGKSTIATAIGSPLLSGDTFGAMGTKIDTLTQTFKNNLTAKGVTVGTTDKMSTLIDKIPNIKTSPNIIAYSESDSVILYQDLTYNTSKSTTYVSAYKSTAIIFDGSVRVQFDYANAPGSYSGYVTAVAIYKNDILIQELTTYSPTWVKGSLDVSVVKDDFIEVKIKVTRNPSECTATIQNMKILCKFV